MFMNFKIFRSSWRWTLFQILLISNLLSADGTILTSADKKIFPYGKKDEYGGELPLVNSPDLGSVYSVAVKGSYAYIAGTGKEELIIADISDPLNVKITGRCNTGAVPFNIVIKENTVFLALRQGGVAVIDIKDPQKPEIISCYDSVEWATGLAVHGNILFICNRGHGLELADISDLKKIRYLGLANPGESQHVAVKNNFAYVGCIGDRKIAVVDCTNPRKPLVLKTISANGYPYGVSVSGNYLYVSTGHHTAGKKEVKEGSPEYGAGHGMEIYDISKSADPVKISEIKTPRFFVDGPDRWAVKVSGSYAFLADGLNGVFVINISNPAKPFFTGRCKTPGYAFDLDVGNDYLYVAGHTKSLQIVEAKNLAKAPVIEKGNPPVIPEKAKTDDRSGKFRIYNPGAKIYAAAVKENTAYIAAGSDGIYITEIWPVVREIKNCDVKGFARDAAIYKKYLYVAEFKSGLSIWDISERDNLKPVFEYKCRDIMKIAAVFDNYIALSVGAAGMELLDISIPENPVLYGKTKIEGYFKQAARENLVNGQYLALAHQFDYSIVDIKNLPEKITCRDKSRRPGGCAIYNNYFIVAEGYGGKLQMEILDITNPLSPQEILRKEIPGCKAGYTTLLDSKIYIASPSSGEISIIDISDIKNPILFEIYTNSGSCERIEVCKKGFICPMLYSGLYIMDF
ncbi:MAG: hypothetical protein A2096_01765 [Spirochaetes bacterium GWF1_41_5]|nr:MAG: hypothetical protein A2096_01765 [Spirochaetes bacterium GWF1_41_5]